MCIIFHWSKFITSNPLTRSLLQLLVMYLKWNAYWKHTDARRVFVFTRDIENSTRSVCHWFFSTWYSKKYRDTHLDCSMGILEYQWPIVWIFQCKVKLWNFLRIFEHLAFILFLSLSFVWWLSLVDVEAFLGASFAERNKVHSFTLLQ